MSSSPTPPQRAQLLPWWPFVAVALFSITMAAWAPMGRKPFHVDWNLSAAAFIYSIHKAPHIAACTLLALLATLASGRRVLLAFGLVVLVGACWELAQTTVIGHTARLSDLAPDALGAMVGSVLGVVLLSSVRIRNSERKLR